jgi:hypothetical protein
MALGLAACSPEPTPTLAPVAPTAPVATPAPPPVAASELYVLAVGGNGFRPEMGLAGLRTRYGESNVVEQAVDLGEGQTEGGAVIFANDPAHRAFVYFIDGNSANPLSAIYVRDVGSSWTGPFGIRIGMPSTELERLNGKPFRFLGFDWDYGGYVSHWTDGSLANAFLAPGQLSVRMEPPTLADGESLPESYPAGDGEFASDLPEVRSKPPVIAEFGLSFVPPETAAPAPLATP